MTPLSLRRHISSTLNWSQSNNIFCIIMTSCRCAQACRYTDKTSNNPMNTSSSLFTTFTWWTKVVVNKTKLILTIIRNPVVARKSRAYTAYVRSPASDFQSQRESDFSEVTQFHARYVNETLLWNATILTLV